MTLIVPDHIVWQDVVGELALFDTRRGVYHALNGSAAAIWRAIAKGADEARILANLAEEYDLPESAFAEDVASFVRVAVAKELLVNSDT